MGICEPGQLAPGMALSSCTPAYFGRHFDKMSNASQTEKELRSRSSVVFIPNVQWDRLAVQLPVIGGRSRNRMGEIMTLTGAEKQARYRAKCAAELLRLRKSNEQLAGQLAAAQQRIKELEKVNKEYVGMLDSQFKGIIKRRKKVS
jgi:hypothetical protein